MKAVIATIFLFTGSLANAHEYFDIQKLGERSYFVKTKSGMSQKAGSNSGFIVMEESVLVIDAHLTPVVEKEMIKEIGKITKKPIKYLVLTHPHSDHIGGRWAYSEKVTLIEKSEQASNLKDIEVLDFGASHSSRDMVIIDKRDQVAFMGDLFVNGYVGYLAEANFKNWLAALKIIEDRKLKIIAPGHGNLATNKELAYYRTYIGDFVSSARAHFQKNKSIENYKLPQKYSELGAKFFLERNIKHAFSLWKESKL